MPYKSILVYTKCRASCCFNYLSDFSSQIRETRQSVRDSESGLERMAIGHHIGDRAHIVERSRNRRTGDREERQDFINLDESKSSINEHPTVNSYYSLLCGMFCVII